MTEEESIRKAAELERHIWEDVIFRAAARAGIDYTKLSAGEVITEMANSILQSRADLRFCCYCDNRSVYKPVDIPGVAPENTCWLCSWCAKKLLRELHG